MPFYFLNNVFLLNLAFKTAQRTLKSFSLLDMNFRQLKFTTFRQDPPAYHGQRVVCLL